MDQRQADRIIALLESIKSNTRGTEIQIDGIASDINKGADIDSRKRLFMSDG